jgi:hypothetical protein
MEDRCDAQQRRESGYWKEPGLHLVPVFANCSANEEVGAAQVGRAQHHGGHSRPDRPGEEVLCAVRKEVEDAEAENQEWGDEQ